MPEQGQTTDLVEHLRKKMMERAAEAGSLQDSEVIRLSQLLDLHLVALMRPRAAQAEDAQRPCMSDLPPAAGEGRRLNPSWIRLHRRRFPGRRPRAGHDRMVLVRTLTRAR
ncbi:aspartyl-phosphate phosphatase Spo0E family protein [Alicyclobacillus mali (ex Roth et al. 2021)]|uniref:aspartyl-phosphate phosphatase Spo0E family protein n=1 Tax=Alicyclobacillus mali (ex Roth et al. 2021) TaxID=1123961 RepID=UPI001F5CF334|nr:aspartyl-phosphate phosphatase Spo0E family protein [Alicyclobacillus mali (ex Roth et al. 2021)]